VAERLRRAGVDATVIASRDETADLGLVDVLPPGAGKLAAIEFLRSDLGIAAARTVFAGDSGNDIDALCGPFPGVLVANAADEVRTHAVATAQRRNAPLYVARGDFLGMNGNYSAGILEGLAHFLPETRAWMA
jgi:hypothetical protein